MNTSAVFTAMRRSEQKSQSLAQRGCQSMVLIYFFYLCVCVRENSLCVSETAKSLRFFYENTSTNTTDYGYEWDQEKPLSISLFSCYCSFYKSLLSRALSVETWGREGLLNPHQDDRKCFKCLAWWVFVVVVILVQFDFFENNWIFIDFSGDQSWTYITEKNSPRESRKKKYMTLYIDLAIILYWTNGIEQEEPLHSCSRRWPWYLQVLTHNYGFKYSSSALPCSSFKP